MLTSFTASNNTTFDKTPTKIKLVNTSPARVGTERNPAKMDSD